MYGWVAFWQSIIFGLLLKVALKVFVLGALHLAVLLGETVKADATCTVTWNNCRTIIIPDASVLGVFVHLLMSDRHFKVSSEVEDVEIAIVVDSSEQAGIARMPVHVIDIVFRVLKGSYGILGIGVPQLDCPIVRAGENEVVEELKLWGIVDGKATNRSVVLVKHGDFLVAFVVQCILVENAIQWTGVVVVGISQWEPAASDVDIVHFLLICSIQNRCSVRNHRAIRTKTPIACKWGIQGRSFDSLSSLRPASWKLVHSCGFAELLDVPNAHHAVVRVGNDVIGNLSTHHIQRTHRVFVGVSWNSWTLNRHRLCPYIPQQDLTVVASSQDCRVGEWVKFGRSDSRLSKTVEFCSIFESWVPKEDQSHVVLDASFFILTVRSKEQLIDLWRPVQIGDNSIGSVVRISEGDSVRQDILTRSTSTEHIPIAGLKPFS